MTIPGQHRSGRSVDAWEYHSSRWNESFSAKAIPQAAVHKAKEVMQEFVQSHLVSTLNPMTEDWGLRLQNSELAMAQISLGVDWKLFAFPG